MMSRHICWYAHFYCFRSKHPLFELWLRNANVVLVAWSQSIILSNCRVDLCGSLKWPSLKQPNHFRVVLSSMVFCPWTTLIVLSPSDAFTPLLNYSTAQKFWLMNKTSGGLIFNLIFLFHLDIFDRVTRAKTWCFQYDQETKRQSVQWKTKVPSKQKKARNQTLNQHCY